MFNLSQNQLSYIVIIVLICVIIYLTRKNLMLTSENSKFKSIVRNKVEVQMTNNKEEIDNDKSNKNYLLQQDWITSGGHSKDDIPSSYDIDNDILGFQGKCVASKAASINPSTTNTNNKIQVINFNTSWCQHSKNLAPIWKNVMKYFEGNKNVEVIDLKCEGSNEEICSQIGIQGFPTIVAIRPNGDNLEYHGDRSERDIINFINKSMI